MLGDLILFLTSGHAEFDTYCRREFGKCAAWLRRDLPTIIRTVKDVYRNRCAHSTDANRGKVLALKGYLQKTKVLAVLNDTLTSKANVAS